MTYIQCAVIALIFVHFLMSGFKNNFFEKVCVFEELEQRQLFLCLYYKLDAAYDIFLKLVFGKIDTAKIEFKLCCMVCCEGARPLSRCQGARRKPKVTNSYIFLCIL